MEAFSNNNIQFATIEDSFQIRKFINDEWKENHILSRDEAFFNYEHGNNEKINFVISKDSDNKIKAVLGFIPCSEGANADIFTVIWKVSANNENPVLGIELLQFLRSSGQFRTVMSLGINKKTIGIYKYLGMHTGHTEHYVILNPYIKEFKIASVDNSIIIQQMVTRQIKNVKPVNQHMSFKFEKYRSHIPYKDSAYFNKRYFLHPIYKYEVYGVFNADELSSIFVIRIQHEGDRSVIRMVDFLGEENDFSSIAQFLSDSIIENQYEYADFICVGFDENLLSKSGFLKVDLDDQRIIIPNYFSPFVKKNVVIDYFADTDKIQQLRICKADGDQDRPN